MTGSSVLDDGDAFFDEAPCGYVLATPDGVIRRVNQTLETMIGLNAAELIGRRTFASLLSVSGRIYAETHLSPMLLTDGTVRAVALELVHADGHRVPVLVSATLAREGDEPAALRIAVLDATERRAYEQELLAARLRAEESEARARTLVRTLQQTLLPPSTPTIDGLELAAVYRPAGTGEEVGGDFYDVFQVGDDDWIALVGDVTGKGIDAAMVTALARYTMRAAAVTDPEPTTILTTLNKVLRHDDATPRWCTAVVVRFVLDAGGWTVTSCHAGHPPALHIDAHANVTELGPPGTLLGPFEDLSVRSSTRRLGCGDSVVLYTDGVTEARSPSGFFGEARLRRAVQRLGQSAHGLTYRLLDEVMDHQAGNAFDDIVILSARVPQRSDQPGA
jgi:phosphoserine phosphatase RsbU/P